MFLLVGLGNPGPKYANHRHNVGFMWIDRLRSAWGADAFRDKFKGQYARATVGRTDVVLLKPETFMNLSGESVQAAMTFFKVPLDHVLVAHDEMDLPFETLRLKRGGGTAGHNGLKSIVAHVGAEFARLRIGVGRPPGPMRPDVFVLSPFDAVESARLGEVLDEGTRAATDFLESGLEPAMQRLHAGPFGGGGKKGGNSPPSAPASGAPKRTG
ncbi:MAG: aminoacyl-tRNA hydrolase [Polyangiales bacterium]